MLKYCRYVTESPFLESLFVGRSPTNFLYIFRHIFILYICPRNIALKFQEYLLTWNYSQDNDDESYMLKSAKLNVE